MVSKVKPKDVVQITNPDHHWYPTLIIVSEIRKGGVLGYAVVPTNQPGVSGEAYIRLIDQDFKYVGQSKA